MGQCCLFLDVKLLLNRKVSLTHLQYAVVPQIECAIQVGYPMVSHTVFYNIEWVLWCRYITSFPLQGNVHLWYYTGNTLKELRIDIRVPPETLTMHRGTCYVMKWDQVVVLRHNTLDLVEHSILLYFFSGLILNILQNIHILAISQSFQVRF